jgi:saccharopine dehydrogenase (NAD+, L-lysine forming)
LPKLSRMKHIGILREEKIPQDNRVAFSPKQCKALLEKYPHLTITVQPSPHRCFTDEEYTLQGIPLNEDLTSCDILFGVKEVKISSLIPEKTYCIFSHTKKKQSYNQPLMQALIKHKIRLIDYECLTHDDGQRVVGFGFFAGVVGAHNGLMTFGKKWDKFKMEPVHTMKNYEALVHSYFGLKLPPIKIVVTGSGRVTSGLLEVMNLMDIKSVSPKDYLTKQYTYPVYTQLKGGDLYEHITDKHYDRDEFHAQPHTYTCKYLPYVKKTDILLNGIYWDNTIPKLFELADIQDASFKTSVIADVTCDVNGSVPCNVEVTTIADPVYGFDRKNLQKVEAYLPSNNSIDIMAVDNLPNELPRDASKFFGEFLEKYIMEDLIAEDHSSLMLQRATICSHGKLGRHFEYLNDYAYINSI